MQDVLDTFSDNVLEVERYFRFLTLTLEPDAKLRLPHKRTRRDRPIDDQTQRILKATALLILYNLAESTVRGAISAVYKAISHDDLTLAGLRVEIRDVWLKYRTSDLTKGPVGVDTIRAKTHSIVEEIIEQAFVTIDERFISISGNLDARKIRKLAEEHGFSAKVIRSANQGTSLKIVKDKRNELAYGVTSFARCGGEFVPSQLETIKKETVIYLRNILRNVKRYIDGREYTVRPRTASA